MLSLHQRLIEAPSTGLDFTVVIAVPGAPELSATSPAAVFSRAGDKGVGVVARHSAEFPQLGEPGSSLRCLQARARCRMWCLNKATFPGGRTRHQCVSGLVSLGSRICEHTGNVAVSLTTPSPIGCDRPSPVRQVQGVAAR